MKKHKHLYLPMILLFFFTSCEKLTLKKNGENTPTNNFNQLWTELDQGYVYFNYKNVNWDCVKTVYEPLIYDEMSDDEMFNTFSNMLETLRDGHTSIRQNRFNMRTYDITQGYDPNFNKEFVINQYLIPNDMDTTTFIRHCFLNGDIGYLYYSTFTNEITLKGMKEIITKYKDTKGLIIDVRGNTGGDASNIARLMEHFISSPMIVGYSRNKIVGYMSLLPNVKIIGDLTGGGGGLPVANQLWNGWFFTYSSTIGALPNGFIIEDGIEPDVLQITSESYELLGVDNIIETAIIELQ